MSNNTTTTTSSSSSSSSSSSNSDTDPFAGFKLWYYNPTIVGAAIYITLFTLLTLYHAFRIVQRHTLFCIPLIIGGIFEITGYILRTLAHNNTNSVPIYSLQAVLLLLAPILLAASLYMVLGRLIRALTHSSNTTSNNYTFIRATWLTRIFVTSDVLCFLVQAAGGGLLASATTKAQVDTYNDIVLGGLIFQILVNCVFASSVAVFQIRMGRYHPTERASGGTDVLSGEKWRRLMLSLYAASGLITLRNVYRAIEYGLGYANYLQSHEWALYVFDGLLMMGVLLVATRWHCAELSLKRKGGNGKIGRGGDGTSAGKSKSFEELLVEEGEI